MSANPYRGEVEFDLNGRTHKMVVNTGVLAKIEEATGVSFFDDSISTSCRKLAFITQGCAIGMSQRGTVVKPGDVAAMIDEEGVGAVTVLVGALMSAFQAWGSGKQKAEEAPKDPTMAQVPSA